MPVHLDPPTAAQLQAQHLAGALEQIRQYVMAYAAATPEDQVLLAQAIRKIIAQEPVLRAAFAL